MSQALNNAITKVVIAGGGTAGWMCAAAFSKLMGKSLEVCLVESDDIPTVGVGEATIPSLHTFHDLLKINEREFMAATDATIKLAISFEGWLNQNQSYYHSFGYLGRDCWACGFQHFWLRGQQLGISDEIGDYCTEHLAARKQQFAVLPRQDRNHAYHLNAGLYAQYLRKVATQAGAKRIEGKITHVKLDETTGFIHSLNTHNGHCIEGDLFIDCSGFHALLIEQSLHTGFEDWSDMLLNDSAIALQSELHLSGKVPYTRSIAHPAGWRWQIPLQSRMGNGIVYASKYLSDSEAEAELVKHLPGQKTSEAKTIKFRTGVRKKHWNKNCVAIGLSSGFVEPLESTSIHLIQQGILRLLQLLPNRDMPAANIEKFNRKMHFEMENIRDFIVLHYKLTERNDSAYWRHFKHMPISESLRHRLDLFRHSAYAEKAEGELFGEASWIQVMLGQGLKPESYHRVVDEMSDEELQRFLSQVKSTVAKRVAQLPNHLTFIKQYCPSKAEKTEI